METPGDGALSPTRASLLCVVDVSPQPPSWPKGPARLCCHLFHVSPALPHTRTNLRTIQPRWARQKRAARTIAGAPGAGAGGCPPPRKDRLMAGGSLCSPPPRPGQGPAEEAQGAGWLLALPREPEGTGCAE